MGCVAKSHWQAVAFSVLASVFGALVPVAALAQAPASSPASSATSAPVPTRLPAPAPVVSTAAQSVPAPVTAAAMGTAASPASSAPRDAAFAAFWSAVAATISAITAIAAYFVQRRNLLESVRPEIVLTGFSRATEPKLAGLGEGDIVTFTGLQNVGKGVALHIHIDADDGTGYKEGTRPKAVMSTFRRVTLPTGVEQPIEARVVLWWKNADSSAVPMIPFTIRILAWDSRNYRHETKYQFAAFHLKRQVGMHDEIAPGLMLTSRVSRSQAVWRLRLMGRLARTPLIGSAFMVRADR